MIKIHPDEAINQDELFSSPDETNRQRRKGPFGRFLRILGPGIITGAADDDPSGIATYSQAGAQFGLATAWVMLLSFPLMTAVQEACMRIGAVTGKGLAAVIRENHGRKLLYPVVVLVVLANTINIGSDIGAMAASTQLLVPLSYPFLAVVFAILMLLLEIFVSYKAYVKVLKWLAIALLAYPVTAFIIHVNWVEAIKQTFIPQIQFNKAFIYILVGILGTTISPYLFFWQTSEVVEEEIAAHRLTIAGLRPPKITKRYLRNLRIDNVLGMGFSSITAWFIIIVAAVTLNQNGITNITSAADAAKALEPLVHGFPNAGYIAKIIFSVGVIGIGLLSVPVLAGSSSYAISEAFGWHEGLFRKFRQARAFYAVIILGTLAGLSFNFVGINPIQALIFTAVFNGIAAVPLIFILTRLSTSEKILGEYRGRFWSKLGLWSAWIIMTLAAGALLISFL
jgi:NRAMP (natural resistance-associated macrophage protein)-like metal ion transporter